MEWRHAGSDHPMHPANSAVRAQHPRLPRFVRTSATPSTMTPAVFAIAATSPPGPACCPAEVERLLEVQVERLAYRASTRPRM